MSLGSGEAGYYAGASAASDSILLQEAIKFLTMRTCKVHLYLDSSAARGIITRQGVGRVKHLQIRTLFLQDLHKAGTISVHPVGTKENTADMLLDIGTKPLSAKRIGLLLHWLGFQTGNNELVGKEELQEHLTQKQAKAAVRMIKSKGNFAFAALLFSGILPSVSEGFQCQRFQERQKAEELQELEIQERFFCSASACEQDVMCADTRACALGQEQFLNMSACAVGTVMSRPAGTLCVKMFSSLKELALRVGEFAGTVCEGTRPLGMARSSGSSSSDPRQIKELLEENT